MAKKEMTWMDVIREELAKLRKEGKKPSIGDVTPQAKKVWADIKAGKHPLYIQGSSKGMKRSKGSKTQKMHKKGKNKTQKLMSSNAPSNNMAIQQMLSKLHLCKKDMAKIQKYLKTQKGGNCPCDKQMGGKKGKRKTKKMKGGDGDEEIKEGYEDETLENSEYGSDESGKVNIEINEGPNTKTEPIEEKTE